MVRIIYSLVTICLLWNAGYGQNSAIYKLDISSANPTVSFLTQDNLIGLNKLLSVSDASSFHMLRTSKDGYTAAFRCDLSNQEKNEVNGSRNIIDYDDQYESFVTWEDDKYHIERRESDQTKRLTSVNSEIIKHLWANRDIVYILTSSLPGKFHLKRFQVSTNSYKTISVNAAGSISRDDATGNLYFIDIFNDEYRYIKHYNPDSYKSEIVIKIPSNVNTFAKSYDGHFFVVDGQEVKSWHKDSPLTWNTVSKLSFLNHPNRVKIFAPARGKSALFIESM